MRLSLAAGRPTGAVDAPALCATIERILGVAGAQIVAAGDGRPARRVLLALDAEDLSERPLAADVNVVVLHRPWDAIVPDHVAVIGCHEPLDRALGIDGRLAAAALGLRGHRVLEEHLALVDGPADVVGEGIRGAMGGAEREIAPAGGPPSAGGAQRETGVAAGGVALADALRPALVHAAAAAGAGLYVTGQWRPGAADAVAATGIGVLAIGHRRSEGWALAVLAARLREALPGVEVAAGG